MHHNRQPLFQRGDLWLCRGRSFKTHPLQSQRLPLSSKALHRAAERCILQNLKACRINTHTHTLAVQWKPVIEVYAGGRETAEIPVRRVCVKANRRPGDAFLSGDTTRVIAHLVIKMMGRESFYAYNFHICCSISRRLGVREIGAAPRQPPSTSR